MGKGWGRVGYQVSDGFDDLSEDLSLFRWHAWEGVIRVIRVIRVMSDGFDDLSEDLSLFCWHTWEGGY